LRRIRGKNVLITGAASGIGRAMAVRFGAEGADVQLLDLDERKLRIVVDEVRRTGAHCNGTVCDLADEDSLETAVSDLLDTCGHVDILVNNAGITYYGPTVQMTQRQCERLLAVNFLAPVRLTQRLLPTLLSRPESHVLNISSMYGLFVTPRCSSYHATKYGLVGYSEALRAEFLRFGMGVTTMCPGYVQTELYETAMRHKERKIPRPPRLFSTTAEKVAEKAVKAVLRNRRLVLATPLAHLACYLGRLFPGLLDLIYRIGPRKRYRLPTQEPAVIRLPVPDEYEEITAQAA